MNILRLFRNAIGGSLKPTGRLVAEKSSSSAPPVVKIRTGDSIGLHIKTEKVRLHGQGDESEAIRVSDSEGISSSVDLSKAGSVNQYVVVNKGNIPQNEEGGEETCRTLIPRLNVSGYNIDAATLVRIKDQDDDADFAVKNADRDFFIQVTRAAPSRTFWGSLALSRRQEHHWASVEACVEGIHRAIERKAMKIRKVSQRNRLLLALDVTNSPALSLKKTAELFRQRHGSWARSLGFESIWIVGPTDSLTHRVNISPES